jgi:hypothetical protein
MADVEPWRIMQPPMPPLPLSSFPGGHAIGVGSGHRPRAVTDTAAPKVVRPPPGDPELLTEESRKR